jgi:hypothetical protein
VVAIPSWTPDGVLPPVDLVAPVSAERAPYPVSLVDIVDRYSTSASRRAILEGFLRFRAALHANGYVSGFQWLDGSFMENIETLEGRAPQDVDVVSFVDDPSPNATPNAAALRALDHDDAKADFSVDSYFVELQQLSPREVSEQSTYWYSVWAHRRDFTWKGFLQIDLDPAEDAAAALILAQNIAASTSTP